MASQGEFSAAMTNRSLRTIRTELEFLTDASVITPQQLANFLSQLPNQTQLHAPVISAAGPMPAPVQSPVQSPEPTPAFNPPTAQLQNTNLNEKAPTQYPSPAPPPPAYAQTPPVLSISSAMYAYTPTDAGDLALQPNDRIQVLEHMNNDWWRGRNERTNQEGIFPRSYVRVLDEKPAAPVLTPQPTNYGNMPLEVAQTGSSATDAAGRRPSKFEEQGKKFGRKMGNAAIFGAGATIGSNIVNGIF